MKIPHLGIAIILCLPLSACAASKRKSTTGPTTSMSKEKTQIVCLRETDPSSPRHTKLHSNTPDDEIIRTDVDADGKPDILERWLNGKRVRWFNESGTMKWTDTMGDQANDSMQIDRDGDGYYDGPGDLNIKWVDDDGDGKPDVEIFAANPTLDQKTIKSGASHFMIFVDVDHDGVNGYIDWTTFEFRMANWHTTGA